MDNLSTIKQEQIEIEQLKTTLAKDLEDADLKEVIADLMINMISMEAFNKNLFAILNATNTLLLQRKYFTEEELVPLVEANIQQIEDTLQMFNKNEE